MKHLWSPWRMKYIENHDQEQVCIFCNALAKPDGPANLVVMRGRSAFAILNKFPYTSGHLMIAPMLHKPALDELDSETRGEMMELASQFISVLRKVYRPEGFNLGANIGAVAGAGVPGHVHLHIVPRWGGDTNFMSTVGATRVMPESLDETYARLRSAWMQSFER